MFNPIHKDILRNWRVLVVDDDPGSLEVASFILRYYGAEVITENNGAAALGSAKLKMPHFVLTDISMPIMDGWTFIDHMKRDAVMAHIPIIALTAHAMLGDRERAIASGCHNYLTKPLTPATFIRDLLTLLVDIPEFKDHLESGSTPTQLKQNDESSKPDSDSNKADALGATS
jgi:CheY-like chemotaxis protein